MIYKKVFKRVIDFVLALIALLILSPVLIICMIVLLLTGEHEVFYFQKRVGKLWYQQHIPFCVNIKIMILTFWVVVFPESNHHCKWLKNLPVKPDYLC